jgi:hypothetical protein
MIAFGRSEDDVRPERGDLLHVRLHAADLGDRLRRFRIVREIVDADDEVTRADGEQHLRHARRQRNDARDFSWSIDGTTEVVAEG